MSNTLGNRYRVTIFGQSHAPAIGAVIEGVPAGVAPDMAFIRAFMARRAPGGALSTARKEADEVRIIAGLNERGETCGAPLCAVIENADTRSADYDALRDVPRPGHADYTAAVKFSGHNDVRGGGQFSGRLTAPLCFAGALAMQLLAERGVRVKARVRRLAGIDDAPVDFARPDLDAIGGGPLPTLDPVVAQRMAEAAGLGDPMFDGVENRVARALFGIPAVRGVEFGEGFAAADLRGSAHNDAFRAADGRVYTETNRCGGALGAATGILCHHLLPGVFDVHPAAFALVGMAGFMASALRIPLTAIVMVAEMSGNHGLLLPAMWVCGISFWLNSGWSLYRSQVHSQESSPVHRGTRGRSV